ncbi:MAG TPA: C10 family peptidase, partial [Methanobacteriaceae archaeon]|nr:C10 family peptidase [Methanobacteriaceae archaeon]
GKEFFNEDAIHKSNQEIKSVEPLIKTKWGQGQYYNDSIPEYKGSKMPVGCVATALAQIMKYYNYPPIGSGNNFYESPYYDYKVNADFGNTQYHWELMPDEISGINNYIAQLCYHVGVAISTDYDPSGSAAGGILATEALIKYFNFSDRPRIFSTTYCENNCFSWKDSLKNEISQKRPVLMEGDNLNSGGHEFICDGYQDEYFHFNFGWNGAGDGYYYLDDIHGFNNDKRFTTNLRPPLVTFAISNLNPELSEIVSLRIISNEKIDQCEWIFLPAEVEFVNGTNPNSLNPKVIFKGPGDYSVDLYANIQGKIYHIIKSVQVTFIRKNNFNNAVVTTCSQSVPIKWFDFDNDGDLDLIQCFLSRRNSGRTILYENNKGVFIETNNVFPWSYNGSISTFDYNNDGYLDIFIMGALNSTRVFRNNHGQSFEEVIMDLPQLGSGTIMPGDINNDDWIDLLLMGKNETESKTLFHFYLFQNNNGIYSLIYRDSIQTDLFYRNDNIADFADLDNDGDLDIVIHEGTSNESLNGIRILINNEGIFKAGNYIVKGIGVGAITTGDFDNDSDVDILSSSEKGTSIFFNSCNIFSEKEIVKSRSWISGFWWARVDCNDFDNDGRLDFTESAPSRSIIYYSKFPQNYNVLNISNPEGIGIDTHLGDYNNDGFVDVAVSNKIFRNFQGNDSFVMNTPPSIPSNLEHNLNDSSVILSWNKSTDSQTPQIGLSYNLRIGTAIDKADVISPNADLNTGKRKIVEMGNTFLNNSWTIKGLRSGMYYWSVQAIDNAFEGGNFAPISSFSIPGRIAVVPSDQEVGSKSGVAT